MKAQDIKKGMQTEWWEATEDAEIVDEKPHDQYVAVRVQFFVDGGVDFRTFDLDKDVPIKEGDDHDSSNQTPDLQQRTSPG